ncbi:hypothetical protein AG1IA_05364 [Rhizoctonia solani AG-1 IA]|uniref:Uncharacterized protein n=1 Tax=Thanatephorus cucumeris (strain AG1-IA) TaxID=983506 RepID=L8WV13_THACA|nr:hypothetical protein AG1IA_05364 [Rhizoctonia solani AG-1 IA]
MLSDNNPEQLGKGVCNENADFLNVNNRALYAEYWQNPTSFSMNPHPQLTPVCRQGADSAILSADVWQNLDVIRIFRTFGVHRDTAFTQPLRMNAKCARCLDRVPGSDVGFELRGLTNFVSYLEGVVILSTHMWVYIGMAVTE